MSVTIGTRGIFLWIVSTRPVDEHANDQEQASGQSKCTSAHQVGRYHGHKEKGDELKRDALHNEKGDELKRDAALQSSLER